MSGQAPKLGLKYWKLRARKLALHLINVAEINAQQNFHGALISYNKVSGYSPESKVYLSSTDIDTLKKIDWQMCFHTHHIVQGILVTNKGK